MKFFMDTWLSKYFSYLGFIKGKIFQWQVNGTQLELAPAPKKRYLLSQTVDHNSWVVLASRISCFSSQRNLPISISQLCFLYVGSILGFGYSTQILSHFIST